MAEMIFVGPVPWCSLWVETQYLISYLDCSIFGQDVAQGSTNLTAETLRIGSKHSQLYDIIVSGNCAILLRMACLCSCGREKARSPLRRCEMYLSVLH